MKNSLAIPVNKMVSITFARRNLGGLLKRLSVDGELYLLRGSKIAAKISLPETHRSREKKKKVFGEIFGSWKNSDLDNDSLWEEILVKERVGATRKKPLLL